MKKVLFLCHGNICRSPIAEYVFKNISKGREIYCESKAVSSEELGNPIYPPAAAVLRAHGVPFGNHRARKTEKSDYDVFDYIIVMENYNIPRLMRIIGEDPKGKVRRLLDFTNKPGDIEDPWYSGNFEKVYLQIEEGCAALLKVLDSEI
ncbi:MAG: low molecular weight phosphotyrosine protein phosphatase [Clostridia bacterium]|nr:low molecular weight phosphotyrosine protein phosphatase [Clostridia bacterium]